MPGPYAAFCVATVRTQASSVERSSQMHDACAMPAVCDSSWRIVAAPVVPVNSGSHFDTGSLSDTFPSSTSVSIVAAVSHFDADAIGTTVSVA